MANIQNELNNIKNALFGQEVRGSIHDGIDAINKEVESTTSRQVDLESIFDQLVINAGNSNAEIVDARVKDDGTSYTKLGDRLDEVDSQLEHIENKFTNKIIARNVSDIENAPNNSEIFIVNGTYGNVNLNDKNDLKIYSVGATFDGLFNIKNCKNIVIDGLRFTGQHDKNVLINDYAYIYFNKCVFDNFGTWGIYVLKAKDTNGITGGTTSTPLFIDKCLFINHTDDTGSCIGLTEDAEYTNIINNEFRKVASAVKGSGANAIIRDNTIMDCNGKFSSSNALIYLKDSATNSAKCQILNNRINHNSGITAIYVKGDVTRNELRYSIIGNHILVHGGTYGIVAEYCDGSVIDSNYIELNSNASAYSIRVSNGKEVSISNNTSIFNKGVKLTNTFAHCNGNMFLKLRDDAARYTLDGTSRIINDNTRFRISKEGVLGGECNIDGATSSKTSTGVFVLTHNLGHINYVVNCNLDNTEEAGFISIKRSDNDVTIYTFDKLGVAKDFNVMGVIS